MKIKTLKLLFWIGLLVPALGFSQMKKDSKMPEFSSILTAPTTQSLFGNLFSPERFQMGHTLSMSFGMGGGNQMLTNSYMNSMRFVLSDNLTLKTDIGIMSTPYHTLGENSAFNDPQLFGGAELKYRFSENSSLIFRFDSTPYYYNNNSGYFNRNPFYNNYSPNKALTE